MKKISLIIISMIIAMTNAMAQERTVENRPYTDLRPFHFGVLVGSHLQDLELQNVGPYTIVNEDGTQKDVFISADQDRFDAGFNVGVLGELRLTQHLQFRVAPAMYFGSRHITFHNFKEQDINGNALECHQTLKTAYVSTALDLIFAAPRFNNHRPYLMLGINPMLNLSGKSNDYLRLKKYDAFVEIGAGCDFYLPFFKLRPELKFLFSLMNSLDEKHASRLENKSMLPYTNSVKEARSKMIVLTFYFE